MTPYDHLRAHLIARPRHPAMPFVIAAILTWAAAAAGSAVEPARYAGAGIAILLAGAVGVTDPRGRSGRRLGVLLAAMSLVLASALLRASIPGPWPGATVATMIPITFAALHSRSRHDLALVIAAVAGVSIPVGHGAGVMNGPGGPGHAWGLASGPLLLVATGAILAFAIQRLISDARETAARAAHDAHTDPLTGLPNRRAWESQLRDAIAERRQVTVAILDLDEFKAFNDTHGHPAGDRLLAEAAAAWRSALRRDDVVARLGGEEFGILLIDRDLATATELVQSLRARTPLEATCSAGLAARGPDEPIAEMVARADAALYRAKARGRDRLELDAQPTIWSRPARLAS